MYQLAIALLHCCMMFILTFFFCTVYAVNALNDLGADLPRFGKPLNNLTISVGREAIFTCIVENLGLYKVAWLRVDTQTILTIASHVITKNHRISVTHSGHRTWSLHIRETQETDRGWYMCQVNTDPMSSNTGFLEVVVPPDIVDDYTSTDMVVREGTNVTLKCAAKGTPKPTVTWRREATTSNWHEVGPELKLTRVTRLQMGPYLCIASNGFPPSVSKRIVLIVHFSPMIWIENQLIGAYEGQSVILECHSEAYPKPIVYWTKTNNETVVNDNNYKSETISNGYETTMKLTIHSVRMRDYGSFRCIATNSLGETDGKIKLYEIPKPAATKNQSSRTKWKNISSYENTAGMKDGLMLKEDGDDEIDNNLSNYESSATQASFNFQRIGYLILVILTSKLSSYN